ncbi:MAG: hypothetical protein K2O66_01110 [Bacteroidales bacterium]|nr:hypothetical protein [Bacteroidales bacterium]MDE7071948.1 hypothetical protein [Bacteroidales bacterium]
MKTVKVQPNQNVFDLAVQHYGNVEAVDEILRLNPDLENDAAALRALKIPTGNRQAIFCMDAAVESGSPLKVDDTSKLMNNSNLKKINNSTTTYETYESWQKRLNQSKKK